MFGVFHMKLCKSTASGQLVASGNGLSAFDIHHITYDRTNTTNKFETCLNSSSSILQFFLEFQNKSVTKVPSTFEDSSLPFFMRRDGVDGEFHARSTSS